MKLSGKKICAWLAVCCFLCFASAAESLWYFHSGGNSFSTIEVTNNSGYSVKVNGESVSNNSTRRISYSEQITVTSDQYKDPSVFFEIKNRTLYITVFKTN